VNERGIEFGNQHFKGKGIEEGFSHNTKACVDIVGFADNRCASSICNG